MPELIMISVFQKIRARWRLVFILLLASFAVFITFGPGSNGKNVLPLSDNPDTLLFPAGFSVPRFSAIEQLRNYPSPRYLPGNGLMRLFNWMDPLFMGGGGQKGITSRQAIVNAVELQEELALHWNYNIVIPNSRKTGSELALSSMSNPCRAYIDLANKYPDIPLGVITFWMQIRPATAGFKYEKPLILTKNLDERFYIHYEQNGKSRKDVNFLLPDSLLAIDGQTQKYYLHTLLQHLTRPINMISENGEEPPGAELLKIMRADAQMQHLKDSLGIGDWKTFMSTQKLHMREQYISSFMNGLPELKNSFFSCYTVEGGPIDRFDWSIMKKCTTPIHGNYYSTPDFYPRWPENWKEWKGPWHGWKWIAEGRKKEVADGDELFSPFVCAGWAYNPGEDIRPGQWLALLKSLAVAGAEFYYVGYFNLSKPFSDPGQYAWQAAMASYAQAVTSRFEKELKGGHLIRDENGNAILSFNTGEPDVLVVVRKSNTGNRYVISASLQAFSNSAPMPESKNVSVTFDGITLKLEARRQGSVYIYEKGDKGPDVFYQLDRWHEYTHPDWWTHDLLYEAEVNDNNTLSTVFTESYGNEKNDFTSFTSFVKLAPGIAVRFTPVFKTEPGQQYLYLRARASAPVPVYVKVNGKEIALKLKLPSTGKNWKWINAVLPPGTFTTGNNSIEIN
ncbi:MAG TPA: hypothetical protein VI112_00865, partial [Bacteroidia bacterium]